MNGKIYIPKPCHENWNTMTPAEQGRHCGVCSKVVTDFTNMETDEIISVLKKSKSEVCGHIKTKELTPSTNHQKVNFWFNRYLPKVKFGLAALLTLVLFRKNATGQTTPDVIMNGGLRYEPQILEKRKVNISVVDQQKVPVPYAKITLTFPNGALVIWQANELGKVSEELEFSAANAVVDVKIEAVGFAVKELKDVPVRKAEQSLEITMEEDILIMGMMVYIPQETDTIITEPVDTIQNMEVPQQDDEIRNNEQNPNGFIFYPNPTSDLVEIKTKTTNPYDVVVYNTNGATICRLSNCKQNTQLDLSKEAPGNYTAVVIVAGQAIETHKIILVK